MDKHRVGCDDRWIRNRDNFHPGRERFSGINRAAEEEEHRVEHANDGAWYKEVTNPNH